jgi:hypothetical protein
MIVRCENFTTFFKRTILASIKKKFEVAVKLFMVGNQTKTLIRSRAIKQCQDMNQKEVKTSNGK